MALCDVAPPVTNNDSHVKLARMTLTLSSSTPQPSASSSSPPASPSSPPNGEETSQSGISLADVEREEDEQTLQRILGQLTDMSPETFEKRKAIRQRILHLKAKAREQREKEREEREKRREEDVAKRRKEREQERKDRYQRIQDLSKTRPDPTTAGQEFLKKRRDSATKMREKENEAIRKASISRQTSKTEELRDEEMKSKMELAKEDRERQMQCMQDIRRMSLTGAAWKSATPVLSPSSLLSLNRRPTTRGSSTASSVDESAEILDPNNNRRHDDDDEKDRLHGTNAADETKTFKDDGFPKRLPIPSAPNPDATTPFSTPNGPSKATLLLTPNSSSTGSRGLKAAIQGTPKEPLNEEEEGEEAAPRYPNAPALRRTSRSWTMPRQSGTEFRRNSRVQPTNVADARKRFEEVENKKAAKDGAVTRSQSFSPASAATSAATIKATLLTWCQQRTRGYRGVDIRNFSSSWADGLAFAAISHSYAPDAFDFDELDPSDRRNTLEIAFRVADETLGAMPLLEVDDMLVMKDRPDWKCVFTYVQSLYRHGRDYEAKRAKREE